MALATGGGVTPLLDLDVAELIAWHGELAAAAAAPRQVAVKPPR